MPKAKKLDGKIVRFMAVDRKYLNTSYPAIAAESKSMATYVTGQHIDPSDDATFGNLTPEEMTGEEKLSAQRRGKFPYIINPEHPVYIQHNTPYDCRLQKKGGKPINPRQYAEAYFILLQDNVADNEDEVMKSKHKFFLDDKEAKAERIVKEKNARYEAEKLIRENSSVSEYKNLIELLNLTQKAFHVETKDLSEDRMFAILLEQAERNPNSIKFCFGDRAKNYLFVSKITSAGIVKQRSDGFYEQDKFLAENVNAFVNFIEQKENAHLVDKWGGLLKSN